MSNSPKRVLIVAGEASGDLAAAKLIQDAHQQDPSIQFFGIGGKKMREAHADILMDASEIAVVGLLEVLKHYKPILAARKLMRNIVKNNPPDLLILVDYPGFNLRLAKLAKKAGIKVLYYISPQIWAWHKSRMKIIQRYVDHMAVVFPFEKTLYERANVPVTLVKHPLVDIVKPSMDKEDAKQYFQLNGATKTVGLLPGSRQHEIQRLLPTMLSAAKKLHEKHKDIQFILPIASTITDEKIKPYLEETNINIHLIRNNHYDALNLCDAVICCCGTATLELTLLETPMVIIYKMAPLSYIIGKLLVKLPHYGLCNIIAEKRIAPELIQNEATPENIFNHIDALLTNKQLKQTTKKQLATVKHTLSNKVSRQK